MPLERGAIKKLDLRADWQFIVCVGSGVQLLTPLGYLVTIACGAAGRGRCGALALAATFAVVGAAYVACAAFDTLLADDPDRAAAGAYWVIGACLGITVAALVTERYVLEAVTFHGVASGSALLYHRYAQRSSCFGGGVAAGPGAALRDDGVSHCCVCARVRACVLLGTSLVDLCR